MYVRAKLKMWTRLVNTRAKWGINTK